MNTLPAGTKIKEYKPNGKDSVIAVLEPDNEYGKFLEDVKIPEGYERVGYEVPSYDQEFISAVSGNIIITGYNYANMNGRNVNRIIVRPREKVKTTVYLNFFKNGGFMSFSTLEGAVMYHKIDPHEVAVAVPVTVEYYKGQGL